MRIPKKVSERISKRMEKDPSRTFKQISQEKERK